MAIGNALSTVVTGVTCVVLSQAVGPAVAHSLGEFVLHRPRLEQVAPNSPTTVPTGEGDRLPQFLVDPFWPKPLPNNWILGQVANVDVDKRDHVWIVQRPRTLTDREVGASQNPPLSKCCFPAPPVMEFDQSGNLLRSWGGPGSGYDWPTSEHGIHVDDNDFVWLGGSGKQTINS